MTSYDSDEAEIVQDTVPPGIEIRKLPYGLGLFATQQFPKGSIVYTGKQLVIPNKFKKFKLTTNQGKYDLNTDTHSVQFSDAERWLYLFDSFMNHSCDPTTCSRQSAEQKRRNEYDTVAIKDINPDDQITCDYLAFEYDCHDKIIEHCLCGSKDCIGRIAGFKYLTRDQQRARLDLVDNEVLRCMTADPENKFLFIEDLKCPTERVNIVAIDETDLRQGYKMIASRAYSPGDVIFSNSSLIFPADTQIVVELNGHKVWLTTLFHTINRDDGRREFYYFDTFQNHSCCPNTTMHYLSESDYELIAVKPIAAGEELTSDYEAFDSGLDGTEFSCLCGHANCRKIIKG